MDKWWIHTMVSWLGVTGPCPPVEIFFGKFTSFPLLSEDLEFEFYPFQSQQELLKGDFLSVATLIKDSTHRQLNSKVFVSVLVVMFFIDTGAFSFAMGKGNNNRISEILLKN